MRWGIQVTVSEGGRCLGDYAGESTDTLTGVPSRWSYLQVVAPSSIDVPCEVLLTTRALASWDFIGGLSRGLRHLLRGAEEQLGEEVAVLAVPWLPQCPSELCLCICAYLVYFAMKK